VFEGLRKRRVPGSPGKRIKGKQEDQGEVIKLVVTP